MIRWSSVGVILIVLSGSFVFCGKGLAEERYTVKEGDTLVKISRSFGVPVGTLKNANHLGKDTIKPKQILVIPVPRDGRAAEGAADPRNGQSAYTVKKGDTLFSISRKAGFSVQDIKTMNQLQSAALQPGQILLLQRPGSVTEKTGESGDPGETSGLLPAEEVKETESVKEPLGKWSNSDERSLFVKVVKNFLGVPYRLGGSTLRGIDCSAFVKKIYEIFNVSLPRTTREQFGIGKSVRKEDLEEGDLVFFNTQRAQDTHVGIYIGNMQFVHASSQNKEVKMDRLDMPYFNRHFLRGVRIKEMEQDS